MVFTAASPRGPSICASFSGPPDRQSRLPVPTWPRRISELNPIDVIALSTTLLQDDDVVRPSRATTASMSPAAITLWKPVVDPDPRGQALNCPADRGGRVRPGRHFLWLLGAHRVL